MEPPGPAEALARFDIEARHPNDFLAPGMAWAAVKRQRENPRKMAEELLATLEGQ